MTAYFTFLLGGLLFLAAGLVGCVVPVLPGPLLAYGSLWVAFAFQAVGWQELAIGAGVVAGVSIADYLLPAFFARRFQCTRWGVFGCLLGTIVGLFFLPLGLVLGPFLGAVGFELLGGRDTRSALKGGFGALLGFLCGVAAKFAAVAAFTYWFYLAFSAWNGRI